jgi:hypothetical protein
MSIRSALIALFVVIGMAGSLSADIGPGPRPRPPGGPMNQGNNQNAGGAAVAGGMMCLIFGVAAVVGIGIKIWIIIFIVTDAKKRGMDPTVWVLVEIFAGMLLGLIIYLCVREPLLTERQRRRREHEEWEEDELDRPRRSRRMRDRNDEYDDRDEDYRR